MQWTNGTVELLRCNRKCRLSHFWVETTHVTCRSSIISLRYCLPLQHDVIPITIYNGHHIQDCLAIHINNISLIEHILITTSKYWFQILANSLGVDYIDSSPQQKLILSIPHPLKKNQSRPHNVKTDGSIWLTFNDSASSLLWNYQKIDVTSKLPK